MRRFLIAPLLALAAVASPAIANPIDYQLPQEASGLKPGPGVETAQTNCGACHSAAYVSTQPSKKGKAFWQAEVQKMIRVYKAVIAENDIAVLVEYLAAAY